MKNILIFATIASIGIVIAYYALIENKISDSTNSYFG